LDGSGEKEEKGKAEWNTTTARVEFELLSKQADEKWKNWHRKTNPYKQDNNNNSKEERKNDEFLVVTDDEEFSEYDPFNESGRNWNEVRTNIHYFGC